jgi:hypothetical protein
MWLANRLREPTTWGAIVAFAGLFGFTIDPELRDLIINILIGIAALIAFIFRENERQVNIQLPPVELQAKSESDDDGYISREVLRSAMKVEEFPTEHDERTSQKNWNGWNR